MVSLFSGIGASELALEALGCETVAHSDIEPYGLSVFAKRFPHSTPLGDVRGIVDVPECEIMAGGFPCQDISNAGLQAGISGARSGLWKEFLRLIALARPKLVLIENVAALLTRGLDVVLADLADIGYACEWDCIPAAAVGAPHLRDRIWITAYPEGQEPIREPIETALGTLAHPPSRWPRAGRMDQGAVFVRDPYAARKTKRLNPGSAWVGAQLSALNGWWHGPGLWPTPAAGLPQDGEGVETWEARRVVAAAKHHNNGFGVPLPIAVQKPSLVGLYPTPTARDWKDTGDLTKVPDNSLLPRRVDRIERGLWPTPRASWNENRTLKRAPSHGAGHGTVLAGEVNEAEAEAGRPRGHLNPAWVEWLMGFPIGWTDLTVPDPGFHGWNFEPAGVARVGLEIVSRKQRLFTLGNAQVPQAAHWWFTPAVERLRAQLTCSHCRGSGECGCAPGPVDFDGPYPCFECGGTGRAK